MSVDLTDPDIANAYEDILHDAGNDWYAWPPNIPQRPLLMMPQVAYRIYPCMLWSPY